MLEAQSALPEVHHNPPAHTGHRQERKETAGLI
jgi:hypothetical protein